MILFIVIFIRYIEFQERKAFLQGLDGFDSDKKMLHFISRCWQYKFGNFPLFLIT